MTHEFRLEFVAVTCDVCGETRFAEEPRCGCEEDEEIVDDHVRRRRRLIWHAAPCDPGYPADVSIQVEPDGQLFDRCSALLDDLMTSFQLIASGKPAGATRLRSALGDFRNFASAIHSSTRLRPWLSFWQALQATVGDIEEVASRYIETLSADTVPEAERLSSDAQSALDRAAEGIAGYSSLLDHWNQIDDSPLDPLDVLPSVAAAAFASREAVDIVDLDSRGLALFKRVTGKHPTDPGLGIGMLVTDFVASVIYDREALWSKAEAAYKILDSDSHQLVSLLETDQWLDDYMASVAELRDAATEAAALSAAATNERIEVRATVRLGARLFEPIARPLVTPLLTIAKGRSILRLTNKDPNVSIGQMRQAGFGRLVEGLQAALRDADAHNKYTLDGNRVLFTSGRAEDAEMSLAQLLDSVLAGMETVLALHFAMTCAFVTAGIAAADLPGAEAWDFSESQKLGVVLGASGWTDVRVSHAGATVEVTGSGFFPANPTSLGGACLPNLGDDVETLVIRSTGGDPHELTVDVGAFRDRDRSENSWDRDVAFIKACVRSSYDAAPIFSGVQVRKWIAMKAREARSQATDGGGRLDSLARLADDLGDDEMAESVRAAERIRTSRLAGRTPAQADISSLDLLIEWERRCL